MELLLLGIESTIQAARLRKIVSQSAKTQGCLKKEDGTLTGRSETFQDILLKM